jgi:hypothetical protein
MGHLLAELRDQEIRYYVYECVSISFQTGRLERELQMVQKCSGRNATRCSYFVCQSSEFCRHNPLYCFLTSNTEGKSIFRYRLSPETFGYILVLCLLFALNARNDS